MPDQSQGLPCEYKGPAPCAVTLSLGCSCTEVEWKQRLGFPVWDLVLPNNMLTATPNTCCSVIRIEKARKEGKKNMKIQRRKERMDKERGSLQAEVESGRLQLSSFPLVSRQWLARPSCSEPYCASLTEM